MATINPYLNFNGNTLEAFNFYKSVFGGEFTALMRFRDIPAGVCEGDGDGMPEISDAEKERIMHISLPIGKGSVLMATDGLESMKQKYVEGDNFSISISAESRDEAEKIFSGLSSDGGKVEMPLADAFWGAYFGMLTDKFGIQWMVNYDQNQDQN